MVEQASDIAPKKSVKHYLILAVLGILMSATGWMFADMFFGTPPKSLPAEPIVLEKGGYQVIFQGFTFDVYCVPMAQNALQLLCTDAQKVPFRDVKTLKSYLQSQQKELLFAMNAGMYTPENLPKGLYIEQKQTLTPLDTAQIGFGNFYLQPNGVFAFDDTSAVILATNTFQKQLKNYNYATQSGPLLVVDNRINPVFTPESNSFYVRNGVGTTQDGKIVFAISNQPVNFYLFAQLFKEQLKCPNALFLDGAISKMYVPDINRFDLEGNLGPFIVLSKTL